MLEVLVSVVTNVALFALAVKLWLWSRRHAAAASSAWRRRVGLLFFVLPVVAAFTRWIADKVGLPAVVLVPLDLLQLIQKGLDAALAALLGLAKEGGALWSFALKPLCYAAVYGGVGLLIGWPLDRLAAKGKAEDAPAGPAPTGKMPTLGEGERHDGWSG